MTRGSNHLAVTPLHRRMQLTVRRHASNYTLASRLNSSKDSRSLLDCGARHAGQAAAVVFWYIPARKLLESCNVPLAKCVSMNGWIPKQTTKNYARIILYVCALHLLLMFCFDVKC